jgi:hypothetical protein
MNQRAARLAHFKLKTMATTKLTYITYKFQSTGEMGVFIHNIPAGWSTRSHFVHKTVEVYKYGYPELTQAEIDQINDIKNSLQ